MTLHSESAPDSDEGLTRPPFALVRLSAEDWLIHDTRYDDDDFRRTVGAAHRGADDIVEVVWVQRIPLPTLYATTDDTIAELNRWWRIHDSAPSKPTPIPHLPPLRGRA